MINAVTRMQELIEIEFLKEKTYTEINEMFNELNTKLNKAELELNNLSQHIVIWRCLENITGLHGETLFSKGRVYEQVKTDSYPMMLIDDCTQESEMSNFINCFTSI